MSSVSLLLVLVLRLSSSSTITHELPRLTGGYSSPLRPGYRWQGPQYGYHHPPLHLPQHYSHHLLPHQSQYHPPLHPFHQPHHQPLHQPPHQPPHHPSHHPSIQPPVPPVAHLPQSTVGPPPSQTESLQNKETFDIEEEETLEEAPRAARENTKDEEIYKFGYAVKDESHGDDYSHQVSHDGQTTDGEYRVALPDGRVQIVRYSADDNGFNADVSYLKADSNETTGSVGREFSAPVVLVKSPQASSDPLFISAETEYSEEIANTKRDINVTNSLNSRPAVVRRGFSSAPANMQRVDSSYYFVPKGTGRYHKPVVQTVSRPRYPAQHYVTNFSPFSSQERRPVRFPPTLKTTYKSKISFISPADRSTSSTTTETTSSATTSQTSRASTMPPLLPAFHPDYRAPSHHHSPRHKKHVPWTAYSGTVSSNQLGDILPAFHPDYQPHNYVTPVPQTVSTIATHGTTTVSTSEQTPDERNSSSSLSSDSLILTTTQLLANLTKFGAMEAQREAVPGDEEDELTTTIQDKDQDTTTTESLVESDQFLSVEETDDQEATEEIETATVIEEDEEETTNYPTLSTNDSLITGILKP